MFFFIQYIKNVGKLEFTHPIAVLKSGLKNKWMKKFDRVNRPLNNYPWTRLAIRIIGVIKRQFVRMVAHVFDNSNLSQEIFAIVTWGAVICSLGHGRKHMLTILPTIWIPGLTLFDMGFL